MRVKIDPNVRVLGNETFVGFEDFDGEPMLGCCEVYEPESGLHGPGEVVRLDYEQRLAYLRVVWKDLERA